MADRSVALIISPSREEAISAAHELAPLLITAGFSLFTISDVAIPGIAKVSHEALPEIEAAIVLGGDGTILRAAEIVRGHKVPIIGIMPVETKSVIATTAPSIEPNALCNDF